MEAVLKAIAVHRRREILRLVWRQELSAGEIATQFDMVSRPAISQHLRVLESAGLVVERREGTRRLYLARPEKVAELRTFLEDFWDDQLQLLKEAAEAAEKEQGC